MGVNVKDIFGTSMGLFTKYRVASRYFFLESILMKALTCTDTAKVPLNTPKCTEKLQEMYECKNSIKFSVE